MLDFVVISSRSTKKDVLEVYPKFVIKKSKDLMIRGRDFYAVWDEENGLWSTDEDTVTRLIDKELDRVADEKRQVYEGTVKVLYMWDSDSGSMGRFHQYIQKHMRDNYRPLDETLVFENTPTDKEMLASKRLPYSLYDGDHSAWDELVGTLYSPDERKKIEWSIGAIASGDAKKIQKFMVLYGEGGTGKSTIINIIEKLFVGYTTTFDAKTLGSASAQFALEPFKTNPLVAIQHDGDLSRIEDNTRLNSVVSHEVMTVNEKFKPTYNNHFNAFLIMGTNRPVKITDAKSGIIRRLIDVSPTGKKIERSRYDALITSISFQLGAICSYCISVYSNNKNCYDDYVPVNMLSYSNDFYNFVIDHFDKFADIPGISLDSAYAMYDTWCTNSHIQYPLNKRVFKQELKNYFTKYIERKGDIRGYFEGFNKDKFLIKPKKENKKSSWLILKEQPSILDEICGPCKAQYANDKGIPFKAWDKCDSRLQDLNTKKTHYVMVPLHLIVIDFDLKNEKGEKDLAKNIEAASKWLPTYAETSNSGQALHLHYFYAGDPEILERQYDKDIEIKVYSGKSTLRRRLYLCNNLEIATIGSGLPIKEGGKKVINFDAVKDELHLVNLVNKALRKEVHTGTKPNVDFIFKVLEDAYESGMTYDLTKLRPKVLAFAMGSSHQAKYCVEKVSEMRFKSKNDIIEGPDSEDVFVFFDIEVFINLLVVCYKVKGKKCVRLINPTPEMIAPLLKMKLIGFNCRKYDNHILYAAWQGFSNAELFKLSQDIIVNKSKNAFFGNAYNISFTDIYDFSSKKQSLKKWEIELKKKGYPIKHHELGLRWDEPVDESLFEKVADYCEDDVIATEILFDYLENDFKARLILADMAGMSPNSTTNSLTCAIIFGKDRNPQVQFNYRDLSKPVPWSPELQLAFGEDYVFHVFDETGEPIYQIFDPNIPLPDGYSVLPFFPGYTFEGGVSTYLGDTIGEGGRVYAEPGFHGNVALSDVASMHPSSIIAEVLFGPVYTRRFADIVNGRIAIKHKDYKALEGMLNGVFTRHLDGDINPKDLAYALKIAINSVYGLTSASFDNQCRDIRNIDNIVAKRGALFMTNLKAKVKDMGYEVAHIKTDSIKIPDATPEITDFVYKYGKEFGYTFEHEATYEKMCLVNDAVYIAKYKNADDCKAMYGYIPEDNAEFSGKWTATGTQFKVPYVFKTLFSHEEVQFNDLCVTNAVTTNLYLDFNEQHLESLLREYGLIPDFSYVLDETYVKTALKSVGIKKKDAENLLKDSLYHDLVFVGKVGSFVPIKSGHGGGLLLREKSGGGYGSATGANGYRWVESENVLSADDIDISYFENFVTEARKSIEQYCDVNWFVSNDPYITGRVPYSI